MTNVILNFDKKLVIRKIQITKLSAKIITFDFMIPDPEISKITIQVNTDFEA